ncbi:MAG: 2-hydroxyacyl-CoA dehydratase family protein [Promethearchaeota archaeon]
MEDFIRIDSNEKFPYKDYLMEKRDKGKKLVGIMAHEMVPLELLRAFNIHLVPFIFTGSEDFTNEGSVYLTNSFCTYARNIMGIFAKRENWIYNNIDLMIRTNYCNGDLCTLEYIRELTDIPFLDVFIPFMYDDASRRFYSEELLELKQKMEIALEEKITQKNLLHQVKIHQQLRDKLKSLNYIGVSGLELLYRYQEAAILDPADMIARLDFLYGNLSNQDDYGETNGPNTGKKTRIMLTGDSIFVNDYFGEWLEYFGVDITYYDTWIGGIMQELKVNLTSKNDVIQDLAFAYLKFQGLNRNVPSSSHRKIKHVLALARKNKISGIINHSLKFCDLQVLDRSMFKKHVGKYFPVLDVERDYSKSSRGTIQTRVEAFVELLSNKK